MREETISALNMICTNLAAVANMVRQDGNAAISTHDHIEVIKHYAHLRNATARIKEAREALAEMEERLSREQVPDVMRAHNIRTTTIEGVGRVALSNRWSCSMLDKGLGMSWLKENGHGGLIQETVNSQTLAAFAKSLSEDQGVELPAEIFKTGVMTITSITKV